jgi:hypothetical protein
MPCKEFNQINTIPINYSRYSAREMAYDREMHDIVNLIDFFSEKTHWKIVQFIGKRFLKLSDREVVTSKIKEELRRLYKKRMEKNLERQKRRTSIMTQSTDSRSLDEDLLGSYMENLYEDVENLKPKSDLSHVPESADTVISENVPKSPNVRFKGNVHSSLANRYVQSNPENFYSPNDVHTQKKISFRGYTMVFDINYVDETKANCKSRSEALKISADVQSLAQTKSSLNFNAKNSTANFTRPRPRTASMPKQPSVAKKSLISSSFAISNDKKLKMSREKIQESYMKSLKKSGLWNKYCTPIIRSNQSLFENTKIK